MHRHKATMHGVRRRPVADYRLPRPDEGVKMNENAILVNLDDPDDWRQIDEHPLQKFKCSQCQVVVKCSQAMKMHKTLHDFGKSIFAYALKPYLGLYPHELCPYKSQNKYNLKRHFLNKHLGYILSLLGNLLAQHAL